MVHYHKNTEDMWILFIVRGSSKSSHLMHHNLRKLSNRQQQAIFD